jgi:glycosyltransferase involved in cell wall biosynthesis
MVAATEAHKNHIGAIKAVELARAILAEDLVLVLIGPEGRSEEEVMRHIKAADPSGRWIQRLKGISDAQLEEAYRAAWTLLQPSFDEGFCLPLIEAGAHGTPAVHSGRGAMAEVMTKVNAESIEPDVLGQRLVELADPLRYSETSQSALVDCRRMSPARFSAELTRLISATLDAHG